MNLLPRSSKDFGSVDYWDKFFQQRGKKAFEWYGSYLELCGLLHKYIKPREKVSAAWRPGCARTPGTERGVRAGCVVGPGFPAPLGQRKLGMSASRLRRTDLLPPAPPRVPDLPGRGILWGSPGGDGALEPWWVILSLSTPVGQIVPVAVRRREPVHGTGVAGLLISGTVLS